MVWPHTREFRNGAAIVFSIATAIGAVAMLVPGELGALRWFSIPIAYFMVGVGFGMGWILAHMLRFMLSWLSPSFAFKVALFYFYAMLVAALMTPFAIALDPTIRGHELYEMVASLPAVAGYCAGMRHVLNRHSVAV
jgi:hypothetical protein